MKAIIGKDETITYKEAKAMEDEHLNELLVYLDALAMEASENEEERSNVLVNLSRMIGKVLSCALMRGVLTDEHVYLEETFGSFADQVKIGYVSATD